MRILVVHSFYRASLPSGENDAVRLQAQALTDAGHAVLLWGPKSSVDPSLRREVATGLRVITDANPSPSKVIADFAPDIVHVHNLFPNISVGWIPKSPVPVIMTLHNYRLRCAVGTLTRDGQLCDDCLPNRWKPGLQHACYQGSRPATMAVVAHQKRVLRALSHGVDTVIYPSQFQRDKLGLEAPSVRQVVVPNFVPPVHQGGSFVRSSERDTFLVLSRLTPEKGVERLLRWWPTHTPLVIAGDGPSRAHLESLGDGLNVSFAGHVDTNQRAALLSRAAALVLPSETYEVDPLVIPEALSAGVPCLVRDHTSPALLARESPAIRVFRDAGSLAESLAAAWDAPVEMIAKDLYESRWSKDRWLSSFEVLAAEAIQRCVQRQSTM
jgi:glycosyltransferase involved in cell wall biosynthesis